MDAEIAVSKQRGRPFTKGQSGNPEGKPKGVRNRSTLAAEALLDGEAEQLTRKAIELALAGDTIALKLCLERILPPRKDRTVMFSLPALENADRVASITAILEAVSEGRITPSEAEMVVKLIDMRDRAGSVEDTQVNRLVLSPAFIAPSVEEGMMPERKKIC
jgi:hypothetical protein